jgi:hypothetical protein
MKVPGILKNKYVCYALMALAALNVIGYLTVKAWECLALFVLAGYSAHCYCKDKSCAILAALFVANFVFGCGRVKEGFVDAFKGPVELLQDAAGSTDRAVEQLQEGETNASGTTGPQQPPSTTGTTTTTGSGPQQPTGTTGNTTPQGAAACAAGAAGDACRAAAAFVADKASCCDPQTNAIMTSLTGTNKQACDQELASNSAFCQ